MMGEVKRGAIMATIVAIVLIVTAGGASAAEILDHCSFTIQGSDMIFSHYTADGWGYAGGAGGVQGSLAVTRYGGYANAANAAIKFNVGGAVDALNGTYGAGNWSIANAALSFASSYSLQNNSRFGLGSGTFDIYWVANNNWAQSSGTVDDRELNPVYATSAAELMPWSGGQSLLGSEEFVVGESGNVNLSYGLAADALFVDDILTASANGDAYVSLYLMATSDTLGMLMYTGGQGQMMPTLSFDVVVVPEPAMVLFLPAGLGLLRRGRTERR